MLGSFLLPVFERKVSGAIGHALVDEGFDFTVPFSVWTLLPLVRKHGGLDYLMASVCGLFLIGAPVIRALTLLALLLVPLERDTARWLHVLSRRIVQYTALDVMIVAAPLLKMALGPM